MKSYVVNKTTTEEETISVETYYETPLKVNLEATGNVEIHINGTIMHFDNLSVPIVIDGELMNVSDGNGNNLNSLMTGDYPKLKPGNNVISVLCEESSTFTNMEIEYRSFWLDYMIKKKQTSNTME